jgi:hypothetical protein
MTKGGGHCSRLTPHPDLDSVHNARNSTGKWFRVYGLANPQRLSAQRTQQHRTGLADYSTASGTPSLRSLGPKVRMAQRSRKRRFQPRAERVQRVRSPACFSRRRPHPRIHAPDPLRCARLRPATTILGLATVTWGLWLLSTCRPAGPGGRCAEQSASPCGDRQCKKHAEPMSTPTEQQRPSRRAQHWDRAAGRGGGEHARPATPELWKEL